MKRNFIWFVSLFCVLVITACSDYPDEWGFDLTAKDDGKVSVGIESVTERSYDAILTEEFVINSFGKNVTSARMVICEVEIYGSSYYSYYRKKENTETEVTATIQQNGSAITVIGRAYSLEWGKRYCAICYVGNNEGEFPMGESDSFVFYYGSDYLKPQISVSLSLIDGHVLRVNVSDKSAYNGTKYTIKFGDISSVQTNRIKDWDLYELEVTPKNGEKEYSGIWVTAENEWGTSEVYAHYNVRICSCNSRSDDGDKGDCVRIGGVDWAKGNLVRKSNTYELQSNPKSDDQSRFSYGTNADYLAHIGAKWATPKSDDFKALMEYGSWQWYGAGFYGKGKLFIPSKKGKRFYSTTEMDMNELEIPDDGIFMVAGGYSKSSSGSSRYDVGVGYYVCEDAYEFVFTSSSNRLQETSTSRQSNLRPVKKN